MTGTCQEDCFLPAESFIWEEVLGRYLISLAASALMPPGAAGELKEQRDLAVVSVPNVSQDFFVAD
jgi:hypothetical protein